MRTRAGLSSENSDCEVSTNQSADLLLCFLWAVGYTCMPTCICQTTTVQSGNGEEDLIHGLITESK